MFGNKFNYANIARDSEIYGPGKRYVIWLQGCTLGCKGCWNTEMWSHKENRLIERSELLADILSANDIVGVTLLGGEPLQQFDNLLWLLIELQKSPLDIMLYSGYSYPEIIEDKSLSNVIKLVDIIITGRYVQAQRNINLRWRGSDNQEVHYLTDKYKSNDFIECNQVEIHIGEFSEIEMLGYPDQELKSELIE
jgi:anaerobic ribonucleoside-triphosphate reductase activating protein